MGQLDSLKVLDFSTLLPGPYASMMLADMGAEVLRIESASRPDLVRQLPPMLGDSSAAHQFLNRGKRAIALDLKQPDAIALVKRMVADADILLEQFRPGVMARLGLDYATLQQINPRLIYCSITGYGQTGPYKDRAGHDINYLGLSGVAGYSARAGQPPVPQGIQIADVAGGSLHGVIGILAALFQREQTGVGQAIDISMTDTAFALNAMSGAGLLGGGVEPQAEQELLNGGSFYDYYATRDGRYMAVGSLEPTFFLGLCEQLGRPDLCAYQGQMDADAQALLKAAFTEAFLAHDFAYWCDLFAQRDLCVEPVLTLAEARDHPQIQARHMVVDVPDGKGRYQQQLGSPIKFSGNSRSADRVGGDLGGEGRQILSALGLSSQEIEELVAKGVVTLPVGDAD